MKAITAGFLVGLTVASTTWAQTLDVTSTGINSTAIGATTASTGAFTTLNTSGNVQIGGTTSKSTVFSGSGTGLTIQALAAPNLTVWDTSDSSYVAYLGIVGTTAYLGSNAGNLQLQASASNVALLSSGGLAITGATSTSGNLMVGTSLVPNPGAGFNFAGFGVTPGGVIDVSADSTTAIKVNRITNNGEAMDFRRDATVVGTIAVTTTGTTFNSVSDARLKTNLRDYTESGVLVDRLRPRVFDWRSGEKDSIGFVAQELYGVAPFAVTRGDDDPQAVVYPWSVDASRLVPVLTAEIKALRTRAAVSELAIGELRKEIQELKPTSSKAK